MDEGDSEGRGGQYMAGETEGGAGDGSEGRRVAGVELS